MSDFDPFSPGNALRIEHAIVDEETQMQRYLAEIAMEDLRLLPDPSARKVRPDSLLAAYMSHVAVRLTIEADAPLSDTPLPDGASSVEVSEFIKPQE
jgi:hypothetical protein